MKRLDSMDFDELLALKAKVEAAIAARVEKERKRLTASLERLDAIGMGGAPARGKRGPRAGAGKGRKIEPKYRNPENADEVWAGRGNRPRWLVAALKGGRKKLEDFAVVAAK
ncbi:H-NS histone family protein [Reyranella sp.]|uniref:H-NS histone family protein n=1 Tax=Reyranella sp. TaxID=1929291 RepID=UPI003F721ABC